MTTKWCRARKDRGEKSAAGARGAGKPCVRGSSPGFFYTVKGRGVFEARVRARAAHLVILIRRHSYEIRFGENVSPEGAVRQLEDVVSPHNVEAGLVLVHGVEYGLQHTVGTRTSHGQPAARFKKILPLGKCC